MTNLDQANVVKSSRSKPPVQGVSSSAPSSRLSANKYNLVHGISERPMGTFHQKSLNKDFSEVSEILEKLVSNAQLKPSVRDSRRIGQYNETKPRSRPILVTVNSTVEVANVLSKSGSLTPPVTVMADLMPAERKVRSILLKERCRLIEAGQARREIKLQSSSLYLCGRLHGTVVNESYQLHPLLDDFIPEPTQRFNSPTGSLDTQDATRPTSSPNPLDALSPSN